MLLLASEDDLHDVTSAVKNLAGRWKDLGISLGLHPGDLDTILSANLHSPNDCLREMHLQWLRQSYNVCATLILYLPYLNTYYVTVVCPLISQGGEVWEANLEKTGRGCEEQCGRQQPCSSSNNSRRSPW